ncbi:unnamed protein product [Rhizopus stolonifer]
MEDRSEERSLQPLKIKNNSRNDLLNERSVRSTSKVTDHSWLTSSNSLFDPMPTNTVSDTTKQPSKYDWRIHSLMVCRHIITRGLEEGVGSDITIYAFDRPYRLHRLILDQNPYFKLLLDGGFQESESNQVTLHLEDHPFINADSFWFVLEYLYGKIEEPCINSENVEQILATCSYFQLEDVSGLCLEYILKDINPKNVVDYLLFAEEHIGKGADRISDAAFIFLCREAYGMVFGTEKNLLLHLPLNWLEKIVESDAFWVPSEYERYQFVLQIIQSQYHSSSLGHLDNYCHVLYRSIHYMYMTFEQLQEIENDIHPVTKKNLVPGSILKKALWLQIELRTKIEASNEKDTKINTTIRSLTKKTTAADFEKEEEEEEMLHYPIPTDDTTTYTGEPSISLTSSKKLNQITSKAEEYSIYPPFRFSIEFADVTTLKHNMRIYSESVFYAGSNWNMYIQKTRSQRKGVLQLGVYLHRQSIPENEDAPKSRSFSYYSDNRKVAKTWFKIFCPSRGPKHTLTLFQSSPDNFSVLQSWGWRSTTLCAEENALNDQVDVDTAVPSKTFVLPPSPSTLTHQISTLEIRSFKPIGKTIPNLHTPSLKLTVVMGHV